MSTFETLIITISFASLLIAVIALSQKKIHP